MIFVTMKVTLISIGKTKESYLKSGIDEYIKRLGRYIKFEYKELADIKGGSKLSQLEVKREEAKCFDKLIAPSDFLVLLDENGKHYTSVEFAEWWKNKALASTKHVVLLIGGAYGFDDSLYKRANGKIAFSKMTFSHQMIRLFVVEQLYRAQTILKGEPYHHN